MSGDWIKMRVWLRRDPRVSSIADFLALDRKFISWLTHPVQQNCKETAYEHITSDITRAITVSSLLEIWGVARDRGDRVDDDLVLKYCELGNLDEICGTPCIGQAMKYVGWAEEFTQANGKGQEIQCVRFPKFFRQEEPPDSRYRKQHAEAQARYRAKQSDKASDVTSDITVTPREEKRREDKTPLPPSGAFLRFWEAWPSGLRKKSQGKCWKVWQRGKLDQLVDEICTHVAALKLCADWQKGYVPAPLVYLNQRQWEGADLTADPGTITPLYRREGVM